MIDLSLEMSNGDCDFVSDDDNMIASCIRRLDTVLDSTLYEVYGSNLKSLLGLRKSDVNLQFLNQSIQECLLQDERITECNVVCEYQGMGILADITLTYEDNVLEFNYETSNEDGVING
jgi:hypothetical protein